MCSDAVTALKEIRDAQIALAWQSYNESLNALGLGDETADVISAVEQQLLIELAQDALLSELVERDCDEWRQCVRLAPTLSFESWRDEVIRCGCLEAPTAMTDAGLGVVKWLERPMRLLHRKLRDGDCDDAIR